MKYEILAWLPIYLLIIAWIIGLMIAKLYQPLIYCMVFAILLVLSFWWQRHFINKSIEKENEFERKRILKLIDELKKNMVNSREKAILEELKTKIKRLK